MPNLNTARGALIGNGYYIGTDGFGIGAYLPFEDRVDTAAPV